MLTYEQSTQWFHPLLGFCLLTSIAALVGTIVAACVSQELKRTVRRAVIGICGLQILACVLFLVLAGQHSGLAIILIVPMNIPVTVLGLLAFIWLLGKPSANP